MATHKELKLLNTRLKLQGSECRMHTSTIHKGLYKKQKRQDWDHKAYYDAQSATYVTFDLWVTCTL